MWSRRYFFRALSLLPTALWSRLSLSRTSPASEGQDQNKRRLVELASYCDTLLPADDAPAASVLGVHRLLNEQASHDTALETALSTGLDWLNSKSRREYGRAFSELDERRREVLVGRASMAPQATVPRYFFELTRPLVFDYYYRNPESWTPLGYRGPPQPRGFADYTQAPSDG